MSYGEFPPLDALPRDGLRKADVHYLVGLLDVRWADLDRSRHDPTLDGESAALLQEQQRIETLTNKLKVML